MDKEQTKKKKKLPSEVSRSRSVPKPVTPSKPSKIVQSPAQLTKLISKDLGQLAKQAERYLKQANAIIGTKAKGKSKLLSKSKKGYSLNPHRVERLYPEEVRDKTFRKQAREVKRKLATTLDNLLLNQKVILNSTQKAKQVAGLVISNLKSLGQVLQDLPKFLEHIQYQVKLLDYQRRKELELAEKIFGKGSTKVTSKKSVRTKGVSLMSKKDRAEQIAKLLTKLGKSTDSDEKRKIRAELRSLGHKGGLGKRVVAKKKKKKTSKKKKKVAKKKTAKKKKKKTSKKKKKTTKKKIAE